jgi:twitching motility protein PilT
MSFKDLVLRASRLGASDLHLESGTPMVARVRGELTPVGEPLPGQQLMDMARELLSDEDWADFNARGSVDLSVVVGGIRCRINIYRTVRGLGLAARAI